MPLTSRRMLWIEASIRYFETLNKKDYAHHYGISMPSVSRDMHSFVDLMNARGGQLEVVAGKIRGRMPEAASEDLPGMREIMAASSTVPFVALAAETRTDPAPSIVRDLSNAIRKRAVVSMTYTSIGSGTRVRTVSPWRFVDALGRLHVQAYDHDVNAMRDFVLTRISGSISSAPAVTFVPSKPEPREVVVIAENPGLEDDKRAAVRADFGLDEEGQREFRVPAGLAFYLRNEFGEHSEHYVAPVLVV